MRYLLLFLFTLHAHAGVPLNLSDKDLAAMTDHVLVAHVVGVDMVDGKGRQIKDDKAMTGPGLKHTIRLKVQIDKALVTNAKKVPKIIYIPLDSFMHYRLGQVMEAHADANKKFLILLAGEKFSPPMAGVFSREMKKKSYFVKRVKAKLKKDQK